MLLYPNGIHTSNRNSLRAVHAMFHYAHNHHPSYRGREMFDRIFDKCDMIAMCLFDESKLDEIIIFYSNSVDHFFF